MGAWLLGKLGGGIIGKVAGSVFGYLNKRGERQADLDTAGIESTQHSKKDEITLGTFYFPLWIILGGGILIITGFPDHGKIWIDTGKDMILFFDEAINVNSFYGWTLASIVFVSLGLHRIANRLKKPKGVKPFEGEK